MLLQRHRDAAATCGRRLHARAAGADGRKARRSTRACARPATARTAAASPWPATPDGAMMGPPLAGSPRVQGASRLRDQDAAARHDRSARRPDLHAGDAADGRAERSVDREHRVVRPQRRSATRRRSSRRPTSRACARRAPNRKTMWTYPELEATLPRLLPAEPTWKATASHNAERAPSGLTLAAWTTGEPQQPDMWFQVELPQAAMITEVQFDAGAPGGGGRGRGGRGGRRRRRQVAVALPVSLRCHRHPAAGRARWARRRSAASRSPTRCRCRWTARRGCARRAGRGVAADADRDVPAGAGEVRAGHADGHRGYHAAVVGAELPRLHGREVTDRHGRGVSVAHAAAGFRV